MIGFYIYGLIIENSFDFSESQAQFGAAIFKSVIQNNLAKIDGVSSAVSGALYGWQLFVDPSEENIRNANNILDRYKKSFGVSVVYLIDKNGEVLASSNRNEEDNFVGQNYSFRPYFQKAISGERAQYVALGVTSNKYGYYISYPVIHDSKILGVVVTKQDADTLFTSGIDTVTKDVILILDKSGVVIFSNNDSHISRPVWPLNSEDLNLIRSSGRLGDNILDPIFEKLEKDNGDLIKINNNFYYYLKSEIPNSEIDVAYVHSAAQYQRIKNISLLSLSFYLIVVIFILFIYERNKTIKDIVFEKERRFNEITEVSKDWVWETDKDGNYTYTNVSIKDLLGYEPSEVIGKPYTNYLKNKEVFDQEKEFQKERHVHVHKSGQEVIMESYKTAVKNNAGKIIGFRGIDHDITQAEKQFEEVNRLNKLMVDRELKMVELKKENELLKNK